MLLDLFGSSCPWMHVISELEKTRTFSSFGLESNPFVERFKESFGGVVRLSVDSLRSEGFWIYRLSHDSSACLLTTTDSCWSNIRWYHHTPRRKGIYCCRGSDLPITIDIHDYSTLLLKLSLCFSLSVVVGDLSTCVGYRIWTHLFVNSAQFLSYSSLRDLTTSKALTGGVRFMGVFISEHETVRATGESTSIWELVLDEVPTGTRA